MMIFQRQRHPQSGGIKGRTVLSQKEAAVDGAELNYRGISGKRGNAVDRVVVY